MKLTETMLRNMRDELCIAMIGCYEASCESCKFRTVAGFKAWLKAELKGKK